MASKGPQHVVVLGGGMAGLAAAEAVLEAKPGQTCVTVVEAAGRVGGVLATTRRDGWLVESSADNFLAARPEVVALASRLGLGDELIGVDPRVRRALVWHGGRTLPVPRGFRIMAPGQIGSIISTRLLSPAGKVRVVLERFVRPRRDAGLSDESLESFAVRRLGREAFERLVQPLASGIWTADPSRLSMAAACPEFRAMEQEHGSLWAGERRRLRTGADGTSAGARYGQFLSLASGMETLPRRLAARLSDGGVKFLTATATGIERLPEAGWRVGLRPAPDAATATPESLSADGVVIAVPSPAASRIVAALDQALAADLASIPYAGSAVVSLGFDRDAVGHPLDAAGIVVPRGAGRRMLAASFSSSKFPGRAPDGCVLVRVFVGGALDPDAMQLDDAALAALARNEVAGVLGARGQPRLLQIDRWPGAMPQYHVGHVDLVARIERAAAAHPRFALAGAAYRGVGIPQVIASGQAAARQVLEGLRSARG